MIVTTCKFCNKEFFIWPSILKYGSGRHCSKLCAGKDRIPPMLGRKHKVSSKEKIGRANKGSKNGSWLGSKVKYNSLHWWIRINFGKAERCDNVKCTGKSNNYDWALKRGRNYSRNKRDYLSLCRSCHVKYDRFEFLQKI